MDSIVNIEFIEIKELGSNALDFQLCALLGNIIGKFRGKELNISIVSNDKGYEPLVNGFPQLIKPQLKDKNIQLNIDLISSINEVTSENLISPSSYNHVKKMINSKEKIKLLFPIIKNNNNLRLLHNQLIKAYGDNLGKDVYNFLKPEIKKIYNL